MGTLTDYPIAPIDTALKEIKEVLTKHNACISWSCGFGSDTHGIYEEAMTVSIGGKDALEVVGSSLGHTDIPE